MNQLARLVAAAALALATTTAAHSSTAPSAAIADPVPDSRYPPDVKAFVMPSGDGAMNALLYTASGAGPHPTLVFFHGFPGNEQNLDLAQAARRAGWNVLTMHYRGSWGSPGAFSFTHATEDAHNALAFVRSPEAVATYRIDPKRIAAAGHSMGAFMAADAAADEPAVIGLFLIDGWNIAGTAASLATAEGRKGWHDEVITDLPPLAGTSEAALATEMTSSPTRFDLNARIRAFGRRPLDIIGAERGGGAENAAMLTDARKTNPAATGDTWPTDHSFSDRRIALSERLVAWLQSLPRPGG